MAIFNPVELANMQVNPQALFNASIEKQLETVLCNSFMNACEGNTKSFMFNIDLYLKHSPVAYEMYYKGELDYLMSNAERLKVKPDLIQSLSQPYVAMLGVLHNYVCVGIDCREVKDPTSGELKVLYENALYTRNPYVLKNLAKIGLLACDSAKLEKVLAELEGNKTLNGFKDETLYAVRLDVVGLKKGYPVFDLASPKSRLSAGTNKDFVLIPVPFYYKVTELLASKLKSRAFKFIKFSNDKLIKHIATFSPDTVRKNYEGCDPQQIETKIKKTKIGFDVARIRIMAYDLESSINSLGTASFRPEMLEEITPTRANVIDKSMHNINYDNVVAVYQSKVKKFNVAQLKEVKFHDVKSYATAKDAQEGLLVFGSQMSPRELYALMKQHSYLFGDIDASIATKEKTSPKVLKNLQLIDLDNLSEDEKIKAVKEMLDRGLVKMTMISKSNKVYERYCSNNPQVLARFLGKDYVPKFESIRYRIKDVIGMVERGEIKSKAELEKVAVQYDILSHVNSSELFDKSIDKGFTGKAVLALEDVLDTLNNKSRKMDECYIVYRSVKAQDNKDLYGTVNVNNIINIEYAVYDEQPKSSASATKSKKEVSASKSIASKPKKVVAKK